MVKFLRCGAYALIKGWKKERVVQFVIPIVGLLAVGMLVFYIYILLKGDAR